MRALAGLHGPTWCDPEWTEFPGLAMSMTTDDAIKGLGDIAVMATQITLDRLGSRMTAEDRETATEAMSLVTPWLLADRDRFSLMHGDYRLDNMLFDPDRTRVTVVDWQTLGVGLPARDLAYFTGDQPAARRRGRRPTSSWSPPTTTELLSYGITDYDRDTCWRDYRVGMLQVPLHLHARLRVRHLDRARRRHDAGDARARLPGHPRSRQPGSGHERSDPRRGLVDGRHRVARRRAARGRSTMTTGTPRSSAASSLARVMSPPLFFVTSASMPMVAQQLPLVVVAVRAARQQQFVARRQRRRRRAR